MLHVRHDLENLLGDPFNFDPYSFHQVVIGAVVKLFDNAIWTLRDVVRYVEKARVTIDRPNPDYDHLHEAARHVIHCTETLIVTAEVLSKISNRQGDYGKRQRLFTEEQRLYSSQVHDKIEWYQGIIFAFKCRSDSMQLRHQNEISLAFNIVAQHHSRVAVVDAAAMKIIAALTVAFLPATFVCAIFSMSFFDNQDGWKVNEKFWVYWAFAVPLTGATIFLMFLGNKFMKYLEKRRYGDPEQLGRKRK